MNNFILVIALLLLNACAHFAVQRDTLPAVSNPQYSWQQNKTTLNAINNWQLSGKINIKNQQNNSTIALYWNQKQSQYQIELSAPLGQGDALITGNNKAIKIQTSEGKTFQGSNPQAVLYKQFKLTVPISYLQYWIKGIPAPYENIQQLNLNRTGYLKSFKQHHWHITYLSYKKINKNLALPTQILFKYKHSQLKIFIKQWKK